MGTAIKYEQDHPPEIGTSVKTFCTIDPYKLIDVKIVAVIGWWELAAGWEVKFSNGETGVVRRLGYKVRKD